MQMTKNRRNVRDSRPPSDDDASDEEGHRKDSHHSATHATTETA